MFVPSAEAAKMVLGSDHVAFKKRFLKSIADSVGRKSLLGVPMEVHQRIRRLLSDPFSMSAMSKFVPKFDSELCGRLERLEKEGKSFRVLDFTTKVHTYRYVSPFPILTVNFSLYIQFFTNLTICC